MEEINEKKVGAGVLTISIITFVINAIAVLGFVYILGFKDKLKETYSSMGMDPSKVIPSNSEVIINSILIVFITIAVILILLKKAIGVYSYFTFIIIKIIATIILSGFSLGILFSFILPILMLIFILQKKNVFGFGDSEE